MKMRVQLATGQVDATPLPWGFDPLSDADLADLTWTRQPDLIGYGWWNVEDQSPQLALYQSYGAPTYSLDRDRTLVVRVYAVVNWPPEQIAEYKKPVQDAMWERIKTERDGAPVEGGRSDGGVLVDVHWFHSDIVSRVKWLGLKDSARDMLLAGALPDDAIVIDGEPVLWKTMAGDFVPVTVQMALDVVEAVKVLDKRIFKTAEMHRAQLLAAYDPSTYDYTTGWPQRYIDTLNPAEGEVAVQLEEQIA
jgi:hypothetical protein